MADLNTVPATGTQTNTQSPQAAGQSSNNGALSSSGVQPGTSADLLNSNNGISLTPTSLPAVSLTNSTASVQKPVAAPVKHPLNPYLMVFSVLLLLIAIALVWLTSQSGKKHNQY